MVSALRWLLDSRHLSFAQSSAPDSEDPEMWREVGLSTYQPRLDRTPRRPVGFGWATTSIQLSGIEQLGSILTEMESECTFVFFLDVPFTSLFQIHSFLDQGRRVMIKALWCSTILFRYCPRVNLDRLRRYRLCKNASILPHCGHVASAQSTLRGTRQASIPEQALHEY